MITIREDAECMTNLISAAAVPAENRFVAFKDANSSPAVLSLSRANQLNLIMEQDGVLISVDFSQRMGLETPVTAFDARQGSDLNLSIAVATNLGNGNSGFLLISNVSPEDLYTRDLDKHIVHGNDSFPIIHDIFMSDFTRTVAGKQLPMVFLAFQPTYRITKEDQLGFVKAVEKNNTAALELDTSWKMATNPQKIISVAFGTCRVGQGAFVLYESPVGVKIQFRTFYGNEFQVEPVCPKGAKCLATFVNPRTNYSVLLVGGETITQFTSQQYVSPKSTGTTIISGKNSLGLKGLHVSVADENATIWYTTGTDSACYYSAKVDSMDKGKVVPLLADGRGGRMSGLLEVKSSSAKTGSVLIKTILSTDRAGNLTLMQQASDTRIWRARPFCASSRIRNLELHGWTLRLQAVTDDDRERELIARCRLRLVSSGYLRAIINGRIAALTRDGDWYETDTNGVLTIVSESKDVASTLIHVDGFKSQSSDSLQSVSTIGIVDPTHKIISKLRGIKTGQDLLKAKTQNQEHLVQPGTVNPGDAEKAVRAIQMLIGHLDEKNSAQFEALKVGNLQAHFLGDILDSVWDAFNYVEETAATAVDWVVDRVSEGFALTITLVDGAYTFIVKTIETIKKGISWVLAKLGIGIEKLIKFAGFVFNWSDILQTSDNFVSYFNAGLGFGEDKLASLNAETKSWIKQLRASVKDRHKAESVKIVEKDADELPQDQRQNVVYGVPFNWSSYQLAHGGFSNATISKTESDSYNGTLSDLGKLFKKEWDVLSDSMKKLCEDLMALFSSNGADSDNILVLVTDKVLDVALTFLEDIIDKVLTVLTSILRILRELGSAKIECPIFTALWDSISGGRAFTVSNLFSLILAVPCTVLYKLIVGVTPPALQGRLTKDTLAKHLDGEQVTDDPSLSKDIKNFTPAATIAIEYISLEISLIVTAVNFINFRRLDQRLLAAAPSGHGPVDALIDKLDNGWVDIVGSIANLPIKEGDNETQRRMRWLLWGIDTIAKLLNVIKGRLGLDKDLVKKISVFVSLLTTIFDFFLKFIINTEEYLKDGRQKTSFLKLLYRYFDESLKVGAVSSLAVATFIAKDPKVVLAATSFRAAFESSRIFFKVGYWVFELNAPRRVP